MLAAANIEARAWWSDCDMFDSKKAEHIGFFGTNCPSQDAMLAKSCKKRPDNEWEFQVMLLPTMSRGLNIWMEVR